MQMPAQTGFAELSEVTAEIVSRVRERRPRVHCITNAVAQTFTANMLLAFGATPSMTIAADEVANFVARADALLVNLGTFDAERRAGIEIAIEEAFEEDVAWVLDPVFIDRSEPRTKYARALVEKRPRAIRLNAAEFTAISGTDPDIAALARYALENLTTLGLTGATDIVTDGTRSASISNGHPLMAKVTAMGCAGSALVAACHAVEPDALVATAAGLLLLGIAGEIAAEHARGPGSFAVEIVDAVHNIDREILLARAKVK
jgi:hydroxyethylthiazole kinase